MFEDTYAMIVIKFKKIEPEKNFKTSSHVISMFIMHAG